jgi:hypothetical protein
VSGLSAGELARSPAGPVVLVTAAGSAVGSRAAAAALACVASEPGRAALLVVFGDGRAPRPSLLATAGARALEERLAAHLPDASVASRGRICQLTLPGGPAGIEQAAAALPLVRASAGVLHLPPPLLRPVLEEARIPVTGALLRADLDEDRPLAALAARDLMERGVRVAVLKRQPGWLAARAALLGALPAGERVLPGRICSRLLTFEDSKFQHCYDRRGEADSGQERTRQRGWYQAARDRWRQEAGRHGEGRGQ